jgi:hypothetical protein
MCSKAIIALIVVAGFRFGAQARIINVPTEYNSIQVGIDHSANGDTVLAWPGIYYEYVNFNGRNIVLGSLYLTTGDTSHISTTVIDGSNTRTVVEFNHYEGGTAMLCGFTIRNGYNDKGGGLRFENSSPTIKNNKIFNSYASLFGGGIYCQFSSPVIINNIVRGCASNY